jgi:hypothetical protein
MAPLARRRLSSLDSLSRSGLGLAGGGGGGGGGRYYHSRRRRSASSIIEFPDEVRARRSLRPR